MKPRLLTSSATLRGAEEMRERCGSVARKATDAHKRNRAKTVNGSTRAIYDAQMQTAAEISFAIATLPLTPQEVGGE